MSESRERSSEAETDDRPEDVTGESDDSDTPDGGDADPAAAERETAELTAECGDLTAKLEEEAFDAEGDADLGSNSVQQEAFDTLTAARLRHHALYTEKTALEDKSSLTLDEKDKLDKLNKEANDLLTNIKSLTAAHNKKFPKKKLQDYDPDTFDPKKKGMAFGIDPKDKQNYSANLKAFNSPDKYHTILGNMVEGLKIMINDLGSLGTLSQGLAAMSAVGVIVGGVSRVIIGGTGLAIASGIGAVTRTNVQDTWLGKISAQSFGTGMQLLSNTKPGEYGQMEASARWAASRLGLNVAYDPNKVPQGYSAIGIFARSLINFVTLGPTFDIAKSKYPPAIINAVESMERSLAVVFPGFSPEHNLHYQERELKDRSNPANQETAALQAKQAKTAKPADETVELRPTPPGPPPPGPPPPGPTNTVAVQAEAGTRVEPPPAPRVARVPTLPTARPVPGDTESTAPPRAQAAPQPPATSGVTATMTNVMERLPGVDPRSSEDIPTRLGVTGTLRHLGEQIVNFVLGRNPVSTATLKQIVEGRERASSSPDVSGSTSERSTSHSSPRPGSSQGPT